MKEEAPSPPSDPAGAGAKFRSGWSSTPKVPAARSFVPKVETKATAESTKASNQEKATDDGGEAEENAVDVENAGDAHDKGPLISDEEEGAPDALAEAATIELEWEREAAGDASDAGEVEQAQDKSLAAPAAATQKDETEKEDAIQQPPSRWRNRRCVLLLLLLLLVAVATVGLIVGLLQRNTNNDDPHADLAAGNATSNATEEVVGPIPLVVERTCDYRPTRTMQLGVVDNGVDGKFWGSASDYDGYSAVIASSDRNGAGGVWALNRNDAGSWGQAAFQSDMPDGFGWDVAVRGGIDGGEGGIIVVGAPSHEGLEVSHRENESTWWGGRGAAVVISRKGDGEWEREAMLVPKVADADAGFGVAVDVSDCGCFIAVGAWHDRDSRGSTYVFSKAADGSWTEVQKLAPVSSRQSESEIFHGNYGASVAITDTMLAVLAPFDYIDGARGVVYVYKRGSDERYSEVQRLSVPQGPQLQVTSGSGLVFLDGFLLVGSGGTRTVYVFQSTGAGDYQMTTKLVASDAGRDSMFGISLDGKGSQVMVRDCGDRASYLFSYEGGAWKEKAKFSDGCNAALSGDSIVAQSNRDFALAGSLYGGPVSFYDLVCEQIERHH